ncbi:hypothetical protein AN958_07801 [Leucoagaricus sp. SymC.cos]|nr:hypothetical protein AN958_07801 [Leucoagaricus sp. SymC.cos]
MWQLDENYHGEFYEREEALKAHSWKPFMQNGSKCDRLKSLDSKEAWRVVNRLIALSMQAKVDRIRKDITEYLDTPATRDFYRNLIERHANEPQDITSADASAELKKAYERITGEIQNLETSHPTWTWTWLKALLSNKPWRAENVQAGVAR